MKVGPAVRPGRVTEKKLRTVQKSGNISPIWGEAPTDPIETKICTVSIARRRNHACKVSSLQGLLFYRGGGEFTILLFFARVYHEPVIHGDCTEPYGSARTAAHYSRHVRFLQTVVCGIVRCRAQCERGNVFVCSINLYSIRRTVCTGPNMSNASVF